MFWGVRVRSVTGRPNHGVRGVGVAGFGLRDISSAM
jgi:hypothetical protein